MKTRPGQLSRRKGAVNALSIVNVRLRSGSMHLVGRQDGRLKCCRFEDESRSAMRLTDEFPGFVGGCSPTTRQTLREGSSGSPKLHLFVPSCSWCPTSRMGSPYDRPRGE